MRRHSKTLLPFLLVGLALVGTSPQLSAQTLNETAQLLAGIPIDETVLATLGAERLEEYRIEVDDDWAVFERTIGQRMLEWSSSVLESSVGETIFYPFSGPDFTTLHRLYPNGGRYVLVALQKAGRVPSLDVERGELRDILGLFEEATGNFSRLGFFLTDDMNEAFETETAPVDGITGLIMLMAVREGYQVQSVEPVQINADGTDLESHSGERTSPETWDSARFTLLSGDGREVLVDYVFVDLSNGNLENDPAERAWIESMSSHRVMLKAASHLMQRDEFTIMRDALLQNAPTIIQDESGIDFEDLEASFEISLFGEFTTVNPTFLERYQRSLAEAYAERESEPLGFRFGYRKESGYCLQYAHTRR